MTATRRAVIAIDGPAGAGKSTAARTLAERLGYTYIDTGAMYRAVGLAACERGVDPADADALAALADGVVLRPGAGGPLVLLDGRDVSAAIREPAVAEWASRVAAVPAVRACLLGRQRVLAADGGVVMDGRDIGTVVLPDADYKFFLTASTEKRAQRRQRELTAGGASADLAATRADIEARDRRDLERAVAPLRAAPDAIVVDTSELSPDAVVTHLLERVRERARP